MNAKRFGLLFAAVIVLSVVALPVVGAAPTQLASAAAAVPGSSTGTPRGCIDLLCPDGQPRDAFCRCLPAPSITAPSVPAAQAAFAWPSAASTAPRGCIDLLCPGGQPRDAFCNCPATITG